MALRDHPVLVVEDDPQLADLLQAVLRHAGYASIRAGSGRQALEVDPDGLSLVLLDLGLPDITGMDVLRKIRTVSDVPVIVVSGSARRTMRADALDGGADDYVVKPFDAVEMGARVRAIRRRSVSPGSRHRRCFGQLEIDVPGRCATLRGQHLALTPTEWLLLDALTRRPDRCVTYRWLAAQLWGREPLAADTAVIRTHIRSLRHKLGDVRAEPTFIATAPGVGYRWLGAEHVAVGQSSTSLETLMRMLRAELDELGSQADIARLLLTRVESELGAAGPPRCLPAPQPRRSR